MTLNVLRERDEQKKKFKLSNLKRAVAARLVLAATTAAEAAILLRSQSRRRGTLVREPARLCLFQLFVLIFG